MYLFSGFSEKANGALNNAVNCAEDMGHTYVGSEHILAGLLKDPTCVASVLLSAQKINYAAFYDVIRLNIGIGVPTVLSEKDFTPRAKKIISDAVFLAGNSGNVLTGTEHLLMAILREKQCFANRALVKMGVSVSRLYKSDSAGNFQEKSDASKRFSRSSSRFPTLEKYGRNLSAAAACGKLDPVTGRDKEIDRVIKILCRKTKNNPCLIGEPGVGKTAVAEGLAIRTAQGKVPERLKNAEIFSLDLTSMVAGAKYRGDFEERIKNAVNEAVSDGNVILFIDEIHNLMGAGSAEGAVDAANILKPVLSRGEIKLIGATTAEEYRKNIEKDAALERRFQTVPVDEPTRDETVSILKSIREAYENFHQVRIPDETLFSAVDMSLRYIHDRFLPDKAIDLLDEAAAGVNISENTLFTENSALEKKLGEISLRKTQAVNSGQLEEAARLREEEKKTAAEIAELRCDDMENNRELPEVKPSHIAECVSLWTGIPVGRLCENDRERLLLLEERLNRVIIGQTHAVKSVSQAVRRGRTGVSDRGRPVCTFLFSGPTGVGKTALAKELAKELFSSREALIRLDMSEFSEKHSVSRLIGSPPGYQGFDEGGQLINALRRMPYCVILFDEIEKAHPDVFSFLLPMLEDGILTGSDGKKADCRNAVIIMTANAGGSSISEGMLSVGFYDDSEKKEDEVIKTTVEKELKRIFPPEFQGRIDETVIFSRLTDEDMEKITGNKLQEIVKRLSEKGIELEIRDEVCAFLAKKGYDKTYGARNLRRLLTCEIETPVAEMMLREPEKKKIVCRVEESEIKVE
ncbi:MAG: ATP-dependent Clp protease ATP-binding subunit [Ruminococcaceae bacterium]|nr:ATP-dependent Clp protease ATP-binding subunit [Oscillospiraceae bacterium]